MSALSVRSRVGTLPSELQHIGGEASRGRGFALPVTTPITGELLIDATASGPRDVARAVDLGREAFDTGPWRAMTGDGRAAVLERVADLVTADLDALADLVVLDNGKTRGEAMVDVHAAAGAFRWGAACARRDLAEVRPTERGVQRTIQREPVGVVAAITPFNAPLPFAAVKLAPALAAGNSVILKPSERAPLLPPRLFALAARAGVPAGTIALLQGGPTVARTLCEHPQVDFISLTGGAAAGRTVLHAAAASCKRTLLELGGKSAQIVLNDADLDAAVPAILGGIFKNAGQRCLSGSRLVVQQAVADEVESRVVELTRQLVVGDPFDPATHVGAMIDEHAVEAVDAFVRRAEDATVCVGTGGRRVERMRPGTFFEPTVLLGATRSSWAAQVEIFGPVLTVIRVNDVEEAIAVANDSHYGLTGSVWTRDLDVADRVARSVRAGTIWVNTFSVIFGDMPFGGFKASGIGREAGVAGYEAYTEIKSIMVDTTGGTTALRFQGV